MEPYGTLKRGSIFHTAWEWCPKSRYISKINPNAFFSRNIFCCKRLYAGYSRAIRLCISCAFCDSSSQFICKDFDWAIFLKHRSTLSL